ncbi:elastase-1-like [Engraulis encrasicolus]|uniref:elastase-1-like n=1 Tax=Engraulis encrasicolus TaxID=184585 RepID=UPI002FD1ACD4
MPITTSKAMGRKICNYMQRSLSSAALHGSRHTLQLPFSGLMEEFRESRTQEALQYRNVYKNTIKRFTAYHFKTLLEIRRLFGEQPKFAMQCIIILAVLALCLATVLTQEPLQYMKDVQGVVVGGQVAPPNSWPWQVSLQVKYGHEYSHICGGTLIRKQWVMTAAHCVDSENTFRVVLGEHNLEKKEGHEQFIDVLFPFIHPDWDTNNVAQGFDIALLYLSTEATLNRYVKLGTLPPAGQVLKHGHPCYITGWGLTETDGHISTELKQAQLPLVGYNTCSRGDWWGATVTDTMVCAGGSTDSGCNGDSGGPLNCKVCGRYVVHGIASFVSGSGCNAAQKPTVFTRVSQYISWMNWMMW